MVCCKEEVLNALAKKLAAKQEKANDDNNCNLMNCETCEDYLQGNKFYGLDTAPGKLKLDLCDIISYPAMILARICEFILTLCNGVSGVLLYYIVIQCCINKFGKTCGSVSPLFNYYFHLFSLIATGALFFSILWVLFGTSFLIPFLEGVYASVVSGYDVQAYNVTKPVSRGMRYKRYCFKKSDILTKFLE